MFVARSHWDLSPCLRNGIKGGLELPVLLSATICSELADLLLLARTTLPPRIESRKDDARRPVAVGRGKQVEGAFIEFDGAAAGLGELHQVFAIVLGCCET